VGYTAEFATEYLGDIGIALQLGLPAQLPRLPVCAEARHQILLAIKEVLNNAAKHGAADLVRLDITFEAGLLRLKIADNGRGFDPGAVSASANGLINLRQRLGALGGTARLESQSGVGTTVTLEAPI
jgi:signal transduction histidine kinase